MDIGFEKQFADAGMIISGRSPDGRLPEIVELKNHPFFIAGQFHPEFQSSPYRCFYSVDEQHNAIVTQFGSIVKVDTAGFYFKAPWQSVKKVDMTTHGTGIGYTVTADGQNIVDTDNGIMITSDFNLLNIDFYLEYRVSDPVAYVYASQNPEMTLSNITMANGHLHFMLYVSDPTVFASKPYDALNFLEITSSGVYDMDEVNFNLSDIIPSLKAGWNEVI